MNNKIALTLVCAFFFLGSVNCSRADSIWARRDKNMKDLYADDVAHHIGDVLTIKISEVSELENKAKRDLEKTTKRSADFDGKVGIDHIISSVPGIHLGVGDEYSNKLEGSAEYKDDRSFVDSITVVVVDVMPNGNLVVMGTRTRNIADDIQTIEVSGIVRTSDIEFDNSIGSERVADFHIVTKNKGISAPFNKPNWLGRIFDVIWPF
jgi:flagellar L-ring protein precursor FlgH